MNLSYSNIQPRTKFLSFAEALTYVTPPQARPCNIAPTPSKTYPPLLTAPVIAGLLPAPKAHPFIGLTVIKQCAYYGATITRIVDYGGDRYAYLVHPRGTCNGVNLKALKVVDLS